MLRGDRLSALDAAFLDLDRPAAPLHVGWTLRLDGRPPSVAALRRQIDARLDRVPRFRRRVVRPPLGLGDPQWADDPAFDVARHVHALRLGAPGRAADLPALAGRLLSEPLDPRRPLWRVTLVDGLPAGFAIVGQAHHALVDGIAAVKVAMLLFDVEGAPAELPEPSGWTPEPPPSTPVAAAAAALECAGRTWRGSRALARALGRADPAKLRDLRVAVEQLAAPAPPTGLDRSAGPERLVAFAETSLDAAREAGRRDGATVNDVLLAAATVALGRALRRRGERHAWVKVLVPVNVRAAEDPAAGAGLGNQISFMTVELPVGLTDSTEILRSVAAQTVARKAAGAAAPLHAVARAGELLPGTARRLVARAAAGAASFNAVVSSIPGPPVTLAMLGRRLTAVYPAVPFLEGHGLSIGAVSYRGRLQACVYADAEVVPDAVEIARDLQHGFDALRVPHAPEPPWRARARARRAQRGAASR
ncbi:MAG TPA: wax ester/triacylglycerol synthase family O-acyltransferase [Solirubrobacteraceae bacterium]|nr:wax ester/triacylglycerol synthase family O-acyltransferase [Solirubrobacteraceae bacterium]